MDRAARNGDERVLLAHILDKCEQSRNRNIPSATDFLSPAEQRSTQDLLHAAAIHDGYAFCGGFERAERRMPVSYTHLAHSGASWSASSTLKHRPTTKSSKPENTSSRVIVRSFSAPRHSR